MNIINYEKIKKYKKSDFLKTLGQYKAFLTFLGSPQNSYKIIIITGSTGKGTTAYLTAGLLKAHGYKTGCYTSPHLVDVKERIKFDDKLISAGSFKQYEKFVLHKAGQFNKKNNYSYMPTFFEVLTAMAFLYFKEKKAEYAVIEVGLGGRLDASNAGTPVLNFILTVCREHTDFLGRSEQKILKEKQEVIKKNSHTVTLIKEEKLLRILEAKCKKMNSKLYRIGKDFYIKLDKAGNDFMEFDYKDKDKKARYKVPLTSCEAIENYGAVLCGLTNLIELDAGKVKAFFSKARFPGRFQVIRRGPHRLILDGGHSILSVQSMVKTLKKIKSKELTIIFTLMSDKKADDILKELSLVSDRMILTRVGMEREYDMEKLFILAKKYFSEIYFTKDIRQALELVRNRDCLITGSFYLIGEFLKDYSENINI